MSVWNMKRTLEGSVSVMSGMFTRICSVFISIHTFFRETPRNKDRIRFIETAPVTALPADSTTDWSSKVPSKRIIKGGKGYYLCS